MKNWIYKAERIFSHQDPSKMIGWDAHSPQSSKKTVVDHITYGSQDSRYLSASTSPYISGQKHCLGSYNCKSSEGMQKVIAKRRNMMLIDWDRVGTVTYDCSDRELLTEELMIETMLMPNTRAVSNASADKEIVITDNIPPEAARIIPPILVDVICAIDQKRLYPAQDTKPSFLIKHMSMISSRLKAIDQIIQDKNDKLEEVYELFSQACDENDEKRADKCIREYEKIEREINELENEKAVLDSQLNQAQNIYDAIPEERKKTVGEDATTECMDSLIDVVNTLIFEDGAKELLEIISQIGFNDIEKRFLKSYYDDMQSMRGVASDLKLPSPSGEMMATTIRCKIIRKILADKRVQDYLARQMEEKHPGIASETFGKMIQEDSFHEDVIFPVAGETQATSTHAESDSMLIGTGLVTKRGWIPYDVEYTADGTGVLDIEYKSYSAGKLQDTNLELLTSKSILNALRNGVYGPIESLKRIAHIKEIGIINLSIDEIRNYFAINKPNNYNELLQNLDTFEALFKNPELEDQLREFMQQIRILRYEHENISEVRLDKKMMYVKCIENFEFMNDFWDLIDEETQEELLNSYISRRDYFNSNGSTKESRRISDGLIKLFTDNFLDKKKNASDKRVNNLSDSLSKALMTKIPGRELEILRLCIEMKCAPDILYQLISAIPKDKRYEILNGTFLKDMGKSKLSQRTLFFEAIEEDDPDLRYKYTDMLAHMGSEITPTQTIIDRQTGDVSEKQSRKDKYLKKHLETLAVKGLARDSQLFRYINKFYTIDDFNEKLEKGDYAFVEQYITYFKKDLQYEIYHKLMKIGTDESKKFAETVFAAYYCTNRLMPRKEATITASFAKRIVQAESHYEYARGRTLHEMIERGYNLDNIRTMINQGSSLEAVKESGREYNSSLYYTTYTPTLYTCMTIKDSERRRAILTMLLKKGVSLQTAKSTYTRKAKTYEIVSVSKEYCLDINNGELAKLVEELIASGELSPELAKKYRDEIFKFKTFEENSSSKLILGRPKTQRELINGFLKGRCSLSDKEISEVSSGFSKVGKDMYDEELLSVDDLYDLAALYDIVGIDPKKYCSFSMLTKNPEVIYSRLRFFKDKKIKIILDSPQLSLGLSNDKFFEKYKVFASRGRMTSAQLRRELLERYPMPLYFDEMIESLDGIETRE